jgi:hypothetical protein
VVFSEEPPRLPHAFYIVVWYENSCLAEQDPLVYIRIYICSAAVEGNSGCILLWGAAYARRSRANHLASGKVMRLVDCDRNPRSATCLLASVGSKVPSVPFDDAYIQPSSRLSSSEGCFRPPPATLFAPMAIQDRLTHSFTRTGNPCLFRDAEPEPGLTSRLATDSGPLSRRLWLSSEFLGHETGYQFGAGDELPAHLLLSGTGVLRSAVPESRLYRGELSVVSVDTDPR